MSNRPGGEFRGPVQRTDEWSWDRQAAVLDKVYTRLLPGGVPAPREEMR